jgi:hypothetical protein
MTYSHTSCSSGRVLRVDLPIDIEEWDEDRRRVRYSSPRIESGRVLYQNEELRATGSGVGVRAP